MTHTVDYLPFANQPGANVESQNTWAVDDSPGGALSTGMVPGLAQSQQANKVWRQSSMMTAAIANYISQELGIDVLDDGVLSTLVTNFTNAINASALAQAQFVASQIAGPPMAVRDLLGQNAVAAPNTSFTLSALQVILRNASGGTVSIFEPDALTVDLNLVGPAANGRDQISIFPVSVPVHIYYIWGSTPGLATVVSLFGPYDTNATGLWTVGANQKGPTLPASYTHAAYATTLMLDAASHIRPSSAVCDLVQYRDEQTLFSGAISLALTPLVVSGVVPAIAGSIDITSVVTGTIATSETGRIQAFISSVNAGTGMQITRVDSGGTVGNNSNAAIGAKSINYFGGGSIFRYEIGSGFQGGRSVLYTCNGYTVPNGG